MQSTIIFGNQYSPVTWEMLFACMCKIIVATKAVWKIQNTFLETEMVDVIKCAETCSLILNEL